jgi:hypothetical protein
VTISSKKKNINLGMAASLPNGNLIVPVIKNADQLNLVGMAKAVAEPTIRKAEPILLRDVDVWQCFPSWNFSLGPLEKCLQLYTPEGDLSEYVKNVPFTVTIIVL